MSIATVRPKYCSLPTFPSFGAVSNRCHAALLGARTLKRPTTRHPTGAFLAASPSSVSLNESRSRSLWRLIHHFLRRSILGFGEGRAPSPRLVLSGAACFGARAGCSAICVLTRWSAARAHCYRAVRSYTRCCSEPNRTRARLVSLLCARSSCECGRCHIEELHGLPEVGHRVTDVAHGVV